MTLKANSSRVIFIDIARKFFHAILQRKFEFLGALRRLVFRQGIQRDFQERSWLCLRQ